MINVIASITVKAGKVAEFVEIFKSNIPAVLKEKGCLEYIPTIDYPTGLSPQKLDGNVVTILEKWRSFEDLQVHLAAPHMLEYRERVKDIVDKVSFKVLEEV